MTVNQQPATMNHISIIHLFFFLFLSWTPVEAGDLLPYLEGKINTASVDELKTIPYIGKKKDIYYSSSPGQARAPYSIDSLDGSIKVLDNDKYFPALLEKIKGAGQEIHVCMYVFKTSEKSGNLATRVMKGLMEASERGVSVEVLLEQNDRKKDSLNSQNRSTAKSLKKAGVRVRFDNEKINTHSKLVIIDAKWVFIGSHNLTHTALSKSNETSLLIESRDLAKYFLDYIRDR